MKVARASRLRLCGNSPDAIPVFATAARSASLILVRKKQSYRPTLDFKGKSFVYTHHLSVPFRELVLAVKKSLPAAGLPRQSEAAAGAKPSLADHLIIHGDNLHALKALLPIYAGKVDMQLH